MIYEVRTYTLKPGTVPEFESRFEQRHPHREKYSKLGAFWHTEMGPLNQVIHIWEYDDLQHREEGVRLRTKTAICKGCLEVGSLWWSSSPRS